MAMTPNGEPSRASGSGPSKSTTSAGDMVRVTRDARIIDLRRDGHTYVHFGSLVGVSKSTVFDAIKRWMDDNHPQEVAAASLLSILPVLAVFLVVQPYIRRGMTAGVDR